MFSSLSLSTVIVVPLLALSVSSVSALTTPLVRDIRDTSFVARRNPHHHHHIARQGNNHSFSRRSARRKRCLEKSTFPSSSPPSSSPASSSYSPAVVTTSTTSNDPALDLPLNVAPAPPTTTTTPALETYSAPYSPPQAPPTNTPNTPSSYSSTGSGETHSGEGTYFDVGLGSCGKTSVNTDHMVAIGWELYDSFATGNAVNNPNLNSVCGRQIRATYEGKSVDVVVLDRCGGCKRDDLDFSPSAFSQIADQGKGRLTNVQWHFI